jgi:hypothetical protein
MKIGHTTLSLPPLIAKGDIVLYWQILIKYNAFPLYLIQISHACVHELYSSN